MVKSSHIFFFIILLFTSNCGFTVSDKSKIFNFKIENFKTIGDKKTAFLIKNNLKKKFLNNQSNEKVLITLLTKKTKSVKEKNLKNQITKYKINLNVVLTINFLGSKKEKKIYISNDGSYDVSDSHASTINNQNNLEKTLVKETTDEIIKNLVLSVDDF
tara:strand:- start:899 stop:1375 length:477 start_codon:yes stop_codon:yes gene_type:complete